MYQKICIIIRNIDGHIKKKYLTVRYELRRYELMKKNEVCESISIDTLFDDELFLQFNVLFTKTDGSFCLIDNSIFTIPFSI